jgi:hypothetical protein
MFRPADWTGELLSQARAVYEHEIRARPAACAARAIPLLVVLIPSLDQIRHPGESADSLQYDLPTKLARGVLDGLGLPFVDASEALGMAGFKRSFLRVDGHLSLQGNEPIRDQILEPLAQAPGWQ